MNLAKALTTLGDSRGAISNYAAIVQMYPDFAVAHCQLGSLYLEDGRIEQAVRHLKRAIALKPDYAEAHRQLGVALGKTNNH